jgi:hypothetical protein
MESFVMEDRWDAERLKEEVEVGDDVAKIANVLGIDILDRIRLSETDNPSQLLPEEMANRLEYAEHKWYQIGKRVARYSSKQTNDGHKTVLEADDEFVTEWLGDRVLLKVENRSHFNGLNPDGESLRVSIEPEEPEK